MAGRADEAIAGGYEEDAPEATADASDRARGADGRFVVANEQSDAPEAAAPAEGVPDQGSVAETAPPPASPAPVAAPQSWSAAAQAEWGKLSPTLQAEVAKREADVAKGFQQYAQALRFFEPAARELEPIRGALTAHGTDPSQYLGMLVASAKAMDADPAGFIRSIADIYRIDLATLTDGAAQPQPDHDPRITALQQRLDQVQAHLQQETARQQAAQREQLRTEIDRFRADPQNKHYNLVVNDMAALLRSGAASDMRDAYAKACRLNDEVVRLEWAAWEKSQADERVKKANGARRVKDATVAGGAGYSPPVKKTFNETLESRYDELFGG